MFKANYEKLQTITIFAGAASVLGIATVIGSDGLSNPGPAGKMPDSIYTEGDVPQGEAVQGAIANGGRVKVLAGAAINVGDPVTTDANGKFIPAVAGNDIVGRATTAASAADEYISIQFQYKGVQA